MLKRTLREVRLLRMLDHKNILVIHSIMKPADTNNFRDVYLVTELMETDLSSVIKSTQSLLPDHVLFFIYQLVAGMEHIHKHQILHRDIKPRNLLVNSNCELKICDFGLARVNMTGMTPLAMPRMTDYVASRWYRAPELILGKLKLSNRILFETFVI